MRTHYLILGLLSMSLGTLTTTAWASIGHGDNSNEVNNVNFDRTISVEAGDMWFEPEEMTIEPGETVQFDITNTGNLEHEFVIGDKAAQKAHREMMQGMTEGHGHGGHDMAESEHGGQMPSVSIKAGETKTLVWTAPENVERLEYACNIPGHYESGMYGEVNL